MIDVKNTRARIAQLESEWSSGISFGAERSELCAGYVAALDELETSRKQVAPCRFDVADARAELARIDGVWSTGQINTWDAKKATRSILDRALAAIDAGWPESAPVAITDAIVEEAAIVAWCAPTSDNYVNPVDGWHRAEEDTRATRRNEVRAVLEYAASLGGVVPAQTVPLAPTVDPRAERLTRYRCAVAPLVPLAVLHADGKRMVTVPTRDVDEEIERRAHRMLAAEKEPS